MSHDVSSEKARPISHHTRYHETESSPVNTVAFVLQIHAHLRDWLSSLPPSVRLATKRDEEDQSQTVFQLQ